MQKVKWAAARIVFIVVILAGVASGTVLACPLGPLYSWYFFHDYKFYKHYRPLYALILCGLRLFGEWFRNPDYRRMFTIPLTAPPMIGPDRSRVRICTTWPETGNACNGCTQCCTRRSCPLLDVERNQCRSYGSFFWRYFNCGRYPENMEQIRFYDCQKWEIGKG